MQTIILIIKERVTGFGVAEIGIFTSPAQAEGWLTQNGFELCQRTESWIKRPPTAFTWLTMKDPVKTDEPLVTVVRNEIQATLIGVAPLEEVSITTPN